MSEVASKSYPFFASFSIELNEVGTSIKKLTSIILCDYLQKLASKQKNTK